MIPVAISGSGEVITGIILHLVGEAGTNGIIMDILRGRREPMESFKSHD